MADGIMIGKVADTIIKQMKKVNALVKGNPFGQEYYDAQGELNGMLKMLSAIEWQYEIVWKDPDEMTQYDSIIIEGTWWIVI